MRKRNEDSFIKPKEVNDLETMVTTPQSSDNHKSWKIVLVPKRGTVLEANLPWHGSSALSNEMECVTIRFKTE